MANDYFNHVNNRISPNTRALDSQINNIADEVAQGFDKLPSEQELKGGAGNLVTNTGTASALAGTLSFTPSLVDNFRVFVRNTVGNSEGATFNLNATGAKAILNSDTSIVTANNMPAGTISELYYDASGDNWILANQHAQWGKPEADIDSGNQEFCPGYTFTYSSATQFLIENLDVASLFRVGRRCKFVDGTNTYFGNIASVDYNITNANDTTVNMTMDTGDSLTNTVSAVCFVTSDTTWVAIVGDPFSGDPIKAIATGAISGTQWWVAVGHNGKICTSTDKGLTWTLRSLTPSTTENFDDVCYDLDNEKFLAVGRAGICYFSSNGSTWTVEDDLQSDVGAGATGESFCAYDVEDNRLMVYCQSLTSGAWEMYSQRPDNDVLELIDTLGDPINCCHAFSLIGIAGSAIMFHQAQSLLSHDNATDTTASNQGAQETEVTAMGGHHYDATLDYDVMYVGQSGGIVTNHRLNSVSSNTRVGVDDVLSSTPIRGFATADVLDRSVCVGDQGLVAYLNHADIANQDAWTSVANGFNPTAQVFDVAYNDIDAIFIAVAGNGQICRSTNGIT